MEELRLKISVESDTSAIDAVNHSLAETNNQAESTSGSMHALHGATFECNNIFSLLKDTVLGLGMAWGALKLSQMVMDWTKLAIAQGQAERALRAAMIASERYSEQSYRAAVRQAEVLQRLTGIEDEQIMAGQKMLMLYQSISDDVMPRATNAMANLAALMNGDMQSAASQLGRAMEGMTEGLKRAGIVIDENVYKQRGAIGVLEEIEKKVEGQAEALAQGSGQWIILKTNIEETKENIGKFFSFLAERLGVLDFMVKRTGDLADAMARLTEETKEYQQIAGKPLIEIPERKINIPWTGSIPPSIASLQATTLSDLQKELDRLTAIGAEIQFAPGMENAIDKLNDFVYNLTASDLDKKIKELDKLFAELPEELKNSSVAQDAYRKALDALEGKFSSTTEKAKALTDEISKNDVVLEKFNRLVDNLTLSEYDRELNKLVRDFNEYRTVVKDSETLTRAWNLAIQELQEKYPSETRGYQTIISEALDYNRSLAEKNILVSRISDSILSADTTAYAEQAIAWFDKLNTAIEENGTIWERTKNSFIQGWKSVGEEAYSFWTSVEAIGKSAAMSVQNAFSSALFDVMTSKLRSFRDYWREMWHSLARTISDELAQMIMSGLFSAGGAIKEKFSQFLVDSLGAQNAKELMGYGGSAILGYAMGGGATGAFTSLVGYGLFGPIGAVLGAWVSSLADEAENTELPSFDLIWNVVDGQIKNVAETWQNMTRDPEVVQAAQEFVQSTTDFFRRLSTVAGNAEIEIPDWQFSIQGIGESIRAAFNQSTTQTMIAALFGEYENLSRIFGPAFQQQIRQLFVKTMSDYLDRISWIDVDIDLMRSYLNWKFTQFSSMEPGQAIAAVNAWLNTEDIFSTIGRGYSIVELFEKLHPGVNLNNPDVFSQIEQYAQQVVPGWFTRGDLVTNPEVNPSIYEWKNFFLEIDQQITDIFNMVKTGMGEAFSASLETGQYQTFEDKFKRSILMSVQQGLIEGFASQELIPILFKPFYGTEDQPPITEVIKQYQQGTLTLHQAQGYISSMFAELSDTLAEFKPIWEILNTAFNDLAQALGLNTEAIGQNTSAIMGPVNSLLMSLDTGPLAPVQSIAGIQSVYRQLLTAAASNPEEFGTLSSFITGTMLPMNQKLSPNYADVVAGVRQDVLSIPWVAQERGAQTSATAIGQEVGRALAPMLLDLKSSAQIVINVVVDGQIIKSQVINSLDDPAVVQKARARA